MTLFRKTPANSHMEDATHADWSKWFEEHGPKLVLCARQWTRSLADAEDVVQDAFVRFWRRQRGLDVEPMGLLLTSVRRSALDRWRKESRRSVREQAVAHESVDGGDRGEWFEALESGDDRRRAIEAALARLPAEQREVLALKIWGERTFEEIGRELGLSPNTAASRYRYALAALRKELTGTECHG